MMGCWQREEAPLYTGESVFFIFRGKAKKVSDQGKLCDRSFLVFAYAILKRLESVTVKERHGQAVTCLFV